MFLGKKTPIKQILSLFLFCSGTFFMASSLLELAVCLSPSLPSVPEPVLLRLDRQTDPRDAARAPSCRWQVSAPSVGGFHSGVEECRSELFDMPFRTLKRVRCLPVLAVQSCGGFSGPALRTPEGAGWGGSLDPPAEWLCPSGRSQGCAFLLRPPLQTWAPASLFYPEVPSSV